MIAKIFAKWRAGSGFWIRATPSGGRRNHPDRLLLHFGILSLLVMALLCAAGSLWVVSSFLQNMLEREARVTKEFVHNVFAADGAAAYLGDQQDPRLEAKFRGSLLRLLSLPDFQRINVFTRDRRLLWSTDSAAGSDRFSEDEHLARALRGEVVIEPRLIDENVAKWEGLAGLNQDESYFVDTYIPIRSSAASEVLGVVEIYKSPQELSHLIHTGRLQKIWIAAVIGAALLYLIQFAMVRSAYHRLVRQQERLGRAEAFAALGEMASSIAGPIQSSLASIQGSANRARDFLGDAADQWTDVILADARRIDGWVRDCAAFAPIEEGRRWLVDACTILRSSVTAVALKCRDRGIRIECNCNVDAALVQADGQLLERVFQELIENAIQATQPGGLIWANLVAESRGIEIRIIDTGCGIREENMPRLFELRFTTKANGVGVGLVMARLAVERFWGELSVESKFGQGTSFVISLPAVR